MRLSGSDEDLIKRVERESGADGGFVETRQGWFPNPGWRPDAFIPRPQVGQKGRKSFPSNSARFGHDPPLP